MKSTVLILIAAALTVPRATAGTSPEFERDVKPMLEKHCGGCHGGPPSQASLDVRTRVSLIKGGLSGPAIVPGSAERSVLFQRVESGKMPPGGPLSKEYVVILRDWINDGARGRDSVVGQPQADRRHWAFQSPVRPQIPLVRDKRRVRTPLDAFVLAKLENHQLSLSPDAPLVTLIRRVTFDLTGLPPEPETIDRILSSRSPTAYENYVDELLSSPRYGERWARHWLDAAGYADSEGVLAADVVRTNAWRYRDYVIRAINTDKPYNQFVREQLAGDEISEYYKYDALPRQVAEAVSATGFLRTAVDATREDFLPKDFAEYQWRTLFDTEQIVISSLLGLTIQCTRCHDHKYEPLTQRDYYSVQAIFAGAIRPAGKVLPSYKRLITDATKVEQEKAEKTNEPLDGITKALKQLQESRRAHYRNLHPKGEKATDEELRSVFPEYAKKSDEAAAELKEADSRKIQLPTIRALYDQDSQPPATHILLRGDPSSPGDVVEPGIPAVLDSPDRRFTVPAAADRAKTTGRRQAFSEWVTRPENPLTARVFVNRVWAAYFGTGIVPTLDNFGKSGAPPTDPELLDWLATEFVSRGWSMKALHRLIVTSSTYRQASMARPEGLAADPDNQWLWRMSPRRLEAEAARDAVLDVAATLDKTMFGEPVATETKKSGEISGAGESGKGRRSVYQIVRRSAPQHFLSSFDAPVMEVNCIRRARSTSATQALAMLNGDFVRAQAEYFAKRILAKFATDPPEVYSPGIRYAFRLAFGREASADEVDLAASFLDRQKARYTDLSSEDRSLRALSDFCQVLMGASEFIYLD